MTDQRIRFLLPWPADALPLLGTKSDIDGIGGDRARGVWLQLFVQ